MAGSNTIGKVLEAMRGPAEDADVPSVEDALNTSNLTTGPSALEALDLAGLRSPEAEAGLLAAPSSHSSVVWSEFLSGASDSMPHFNPLFVTPDAVNKEYAFSKIVMRPIAEDAILNMEERLGAGNLSWAASAMAGLEADGAQYSVGSKELNLLRGLKEEFTTGALAA